MITHLQVESLTKSFGDLELFRNVTFGISDNQRVGLIAKNGSGKTTLLNIIAGREDYDDGAVVFRRDVRVGYLEQNPQFPTEMSVLDACFFGDNDSLRAIIAYEKALASDDHTLLEDAINQMDALKAWDYEHRAKQILTQLKITDFDQRVNQLSGGQLKRVALAGVLISEPDVLILDEPTNHLDIDMTQWLEEYLKQTNVSLLMVTHDRYFLDRVCSDIIEIDNKTIYSYKGNYSYYLEKRQERIDAASSQMESDRNIYRKELEWMRRQPQARATKAKSRIDAFYDLEEKTRNQRYVGDVKLSVKSSYIGKKIFEVKGLSKSFGDKKILDNFDYIFSRFEKMGIVGDNGTGKSTFIKMLMGQVAADSGTIDIGETVNFGYYSQDGLQFDEQMKVIDVVQDIAEEIALGDGQKLSASQFLQYFLFTPETQHNYVYKLSGGEKRRLYLCTVLMRNPNFLVLDEPTNDLDIMTLNVLEDYLQGFGGCVIVVSHDRYFMDKVADHLLVFKGNGELKNFPGNYTDFLDWNKQQEQLERQKQQQAQPKEDKPTSRNKPTDTTKKRLTFAERREFESLEKEIPALEAERAEIETAMSSGTLSQDELMTKAQRISELITLIDDKSMRWLELSELA